LPWERSIYEKDNKKKEVSGVPWLALLVFDENQLAPPGTDEKNKQLATFGYNFTMEQMQGDTQTLAFKKAIKDNPVYAKTSMNWPSLEEDVVLDPKEPLSIIFPNRGVLEPLLPDAQDLKFLAHVRHEEDENGQVINDGEEKAVIIANRLPNPGTDTIVHLVSLEHRYAWDNNKNDYEFDFRSAEQTDLIPLITLQSWRFSSLSARHNFRGAMLNLNHTPLFRIPITPEIRNALKVGKTLPTELTSAFAQAKHPLSNPPPSISNQGKFVLFENNHHYIIAQDGMLYTQAGVPFYKIKYFNKTWSKDPVLQRIQEAQQDPNDDLNFPKLGNLTIAQVADNYWWLEDMNQQFFLDVEGDELIAYKIFKDQTPVLRLPLVADNPLANKYMQQGYVPIPHYMRQGSKTLSWYRGPLATSPQSYTLNTDPLHVNTSDLLLRYHTDTATFDCSYAAAWELGRLLALRDKSFSVKLEKWKRSHRQFIAQVEQSQSTQHLPFGNKKGKDQAEMPEELWNWFDKLLDLEAVPFNYLVPDERMLPAESIRFFYLDPNWMQALFLGAFSLGRPLDQDRHGDPTLRNGTPLLDTGIARTGFMMRSSVISGWPDLQLEAYLKTDPVNPLSMIKQKLTDNIVLCLIDGEPDEIDFFLKATQLHFGFYKSDPSSIDYHKKFRNKDGKEMLITDKIGNPLPPSDEMLDMDSRTLKIKGLAKFINEHLDFPEMDSASFALSMIEGVARFKWKKSG